MKAKSWEELEEPVEFMYRQIYLLCSTVQYMTAVSIKYHSKALAKVSKSRPHISSSRSGIELV